MFIYPYRQGSKSVAALAEALKAKIIKLEDSKFRGSSDKIVINWGNSMETEELKKASVLNKPSAVKVASNKLDFFNMVKGQIPIPDFTLSQQEARDWLLNGDTLFVRENLNGHSGQGIISFEDVISFDGYDHRRAKLYVKYIPKKHEYRVHVIDGKVVDVQQKRLRKGVFKPNFRVRNHDTGFIYAREDVELPDKKIEQDSILAVQLCGLHFGAVDVIWNNHRKVGYILEVNTAPGLEGETVNKYVDEFITALNSTAFTSRAAPIHQDANPWPPRPTIVHRAPDPEQLLWINTHAEPTGQR